MVISCIKKILHICCILIIVFLCIGVKEIWAEDEADSKAFLRQVEGNFKDLKVKK